MSPRTARLVSRGIVAAIIVVVVADVALSLAISGRYDTSTIAVVGDPHAPGMAEVRADLEARLAEGARFEPDVLGSWLVSAIALIWAITGSLIVSRQPRNTAGWIFAGWGAAVATILLSGGYAGYSVRVAAAPLPGQDVAALIAENGLAFVILIPLLVLLFPDGRPPSPRWRWASRALIGGGALAVTAFALTPGPLNNLVDNGGILYDNPIGLGAFREGGPGNALVFIGMILVLGASLSTVVAVWQRFRRARGEERQQMRWLVADATVAGAGMVLLWLGAGVSAVVGPGDNGDGWLFALFFVPTVAAIFLGIPAAYLIAILRYGLWDLDVVIKKTAVALVLTGLLVLVGAAILAVFGQFAIWEGANPRVSVAVGIIFGLLFVPLLRLSRRVATKIIFGHRATPYEVLTEFSHRVGETYANDDVSARMAQLVVDATGATAAQVLLRVGGEERAAAAVGEPTGAPHVVPVLHQGERLGEIAVTMPANDPLDPSKERLVADLAAQAGPVFRNMRLIEELRASRQRLVAAQDEERRKLERNIHDGAQQQLVALAVKLRLAQGLVAKDPEKAATMLGDLQSEAQTTLEDLRDLARGIYPPLLADQGLGAALAAQAKRAPVPVTVESDGIDRYPQGVESAVYFCALEALNNVAKYADASSVTIRLSDGDGRLVFSVADDGRGFDPAETGHGTGLQGMADRLDAIGGSLEVVSAPGAGTTVTGRVSTDGSASE
ncbi:MAG TPA: sensor histidine kinase [Actinomycetota bacterium]|nr:sensor histidine kinase [Actinomycetota bacterium]